MKLSHYHPPLDFPPLPGFRLFAGIPHRFPALGPLAGGILAALVILRALSWLPAGEQINGMAALVGISAWLYFGQTLRGSSLGQMALDVATATLVLVLATQARSTPSVLMGLAFAVQVLWTVIQLEGKIRRDRDDRSLLFAWLSFNLVLAASAWFLFN